MQHAGLQYGQGAANSHQSPPFAHTDISFSKQHQSNGGNATSSLRQFRKKDGLDKNSSTDLNTSITENSHIARVAPQNHYPARPNDYYRYHPQYPDYNSSYKEPIAQVKYSEIAETPSQVLQHVDHIPPALQKHKENHKDFMDMCNLSQQTHMKQNYPDNLARQQSYPPDAASMHHHQYLHKEPQVHPNYKPESQYQQYPQLAKYNMPSQCRKYPPPPPPPPENDFLAKLQRINPSMARSIMSDHHIRESQANAYPNQMYPQNQRYYATHLQNNPAYNYHVPYNYPSCNYKHPEYPRPAQAQYPPVAPERSVSPRNVHVNYTAQKISPGYNQYEYAQHYQHRRASVPQEYYQQTCRSSHPYVPSHQISPEPNDNRAASSGLRHFLENWAEEEAAAPPSQEGLFKETAPRMHGEAAGGNEQVFVINSTDIPQCLENVSLVPTENGQYIIKSGALDNSLVRIKETTENNGERTVNLQIVEATTPKSDCMLETAPEESPVKTNEEPPTTVPYVENQTAKDCDEATTTHQEEGRVEEAAEKNDSVIVCNEVSVIKDMPLIEELHEDKTLPEDSTTLQDPPMDEEEGDESEENEPEDETTQEEGTSKTELQLDTHITTTTKRSQRIFSVDDIINNIGHSSNQERRSSLQEIIDEDLSQERSEDASVTTEKPEEDALPTEEEEVEYTSAISIEDDSVILEIGGALVQLNINHFNGTKILSVLPLSESLVIDVNGNYQSCADICSEGNEDSDMVNVGKDGEPSEVLEDESRNQQESQLEIVEDIQEPQQVEEDISTGVCQSEIVIGEESEDNEVFIDLNANSEESVSVEEKMEEVHEDEEIQERDVEAIEDIIEPRVIENDEVTAILEEKEVEKTLTETNAETTLEEMEIHEKDEVNENLEVKEVDKKLEQNKFKEKKEDKEVEDKREEKEVKEVTEMIDKLKPTEVLKRKEKKAVVEEKNKVKASEDDKRRPSSGKRVRVDQEKKQIEERPKAKKVQHTLQEDHSKSRKGKWSTDIKNDGYLQVTSDRSEERPEEEPSKKEEIEKKEDKPLSLSTKAAKKLYTNDNPVRKSSKDRESRSKTVDKPSRPKKDVKKSRAQLEQTVNKIKSLKEKAAKKDPKPKESPVKEVQDSKKSRAVKKVTFNLETEVHEITKEEMEKKRLSLEEYNNRKRKPSPDCKEEKIMEDTVTSSEDINDQVMEQVEKSIENAIKDSVLKKCKVTESRWEDDPDSPKASEKKSNRCIIDVNEFNIKPIESVSTPSPISSSQFSYHSEDDSLQVYKEVVDSKLNSLNINIPKVKPKPVDKVSALLERFLNTSSLNCSELEKVKKIIEFKRKIEEKQLTYEVHGKRDYNDLKLHIKKVPPEKKPKKRFRNLYTQDTSSEDSDSTRSGKAVGDYSVYQRSSHQGVPKLIFKRNSGLPQPFVKLERSQAVELLAKKRKLY